MPTLARWRSTWTGLGVAPPADGVHAALIARYGEPHRRYHTVQHLDECFARLDEGRALAEHVHEVELALWFHDAVYDTHRADNEAESAALARAEGGRAGLAEPRPRLYGTDAFRERFEDPARANLARSILALGG